ncbi:hypothetical protein BSKO_11004 [Bryopsis sp. KO-2023]|nr:hypothetical protein BSKO_11004 [Bryopsis sp. KO-2023]
MAFRLDSFSCARLPDDDKCSNGCGWKCDCYACSGNSDSTWEECQCSCRFWVVVCFIVLIGFFVVFYVATIFRRVLLYSMASGAVIVAGALSALSAVTDECGWPAFFSISLVFAFPCAYSCCWQCQQHRSNARDAGRGSPGAEAKPSNAVVMLFPGGEVQLGVMTDEPKVEQTPQKKTRRKNQRRNRDRDSGDIESGSGQTLEAPSTSGATPD